MPDAPVDVAPDVFHLWPENVAAWNLFMALQTQWRLSMAGREGLDYVGVHAVIDSQRAWRKHRRQHFERVKVMERAALAAWAEQARNAPPRK